MIPSSTPTAHALFTGGRLEDAVTQLGLELRQDPSDAQRRSFLFELLSFAGDYARAEKQLDVLASAGPKAEAGVAVYKAALQAERVREHMFDTGDLPQGAAPASGPGSCNGEEFADVTDGDPRLGARLEVIAGGRYLWIPFAHIASVVVQAPTQLRDLRWLSARIATNASVRDMELGEVLLPAITPAAWRQDDPELRLGRATDWFELADGEFAPLGQKVLRIGDRIVPLVDVRELQFTPQS